MASRINLILIVLLGVILRASTLGSNSLWLDEYTSIEVSLKSIRDILDGVGFNHHTPPLYYILLHFWLQLVPVNEIGLRSFSLFWDVLNILLMFVVVRELSTKRAGLIAAAVYSVAPFAVYFAQEGRMYTLLVTEVLLLWFLAIRAARRPLTKAEMASLAIVLCLGAYTHYYFVFAALSLSAVIFGSTLRLKDWSRLWSWLWPCLIAALAFVPWLGVVRELATSDGQTFRRFLVSVIPYTAFRYVAGYGVFPLTIAAKEHMANAVASHLLLLLPYAVVLLGFGWVVVAEIRKEVTVRIMLIMALLFGPAFIAFLISLKTPILSERYLVVSFPAFVCLLALLFAEWRRRAVPSLVVVLLLFGLVQHYRNPEAGYTQWREAARYVQKSVVTKDSRFVIVNPEYARGLMKFYLPANYLIVGFYGRDKAAELTALTAEIRQHQRLWLVENLNVESIEGLVSSLGFGEVSEEIFPLENGLRVQYLEAATPAKGPANNQAIDGAS